MNWCWICCPCSQCVYQVCTVMSETPLKGTTVQYQPGRMPFVPGKPNIITYYFNSCPWISSTFFIEPVLRSNFIESGSRCRISDISGLDLEFWWHNCKKFQLNTHTGSMGPVYFPFITKTKPFDVLLWPRSAAGMMGGVGGGGGMDGGPRGRNDGRHGGGGLPLGGGGGMMGGGGPSILGGPMMGGGGGGMGGGSSHALAALASLASSQIRWDAQINLLHSVADPGCLSRILIFTHPGPRISYPGSRISDLGSWILDPKTATKERGEKKFVVILFFVATKFTKLNTYYFVFEMLKKNVGQISRIIEVFTQKIVTKLSQIWFWDPRSGKNLFRIPDSGVKKAPDPGSGSATLLLQQLDWITRVFWIHGPGFSLSGPGSNGIKFNKYLKGIFLLDRTLVDRRKYPFVLKNILQAGVPDPWHFETNPGPWIRTLEYGSGSGSCSFRQWLSRCQEKEITLWVKSRIRNRLIPGPDPGVKQSPNHWIPDAAPPQWKKVLFVMKKIVEKKREQK
jgi:hypothetical protein